MKKNYLLAVFCVIGFFCKAQTINIPDIEFKTQLLSGFNTQNLSGNEISIDLNLDGEIQLNEALLVYGLTLYSPIANFEGLQYFTNVKTLEISGGSGITPLLDLGTMNNLNSVTIGNTDFITISISSNVLTHVAITNNSNLTAINFVSLSNLSELDLSHNKLAAFSFSLLGPSISYIDLSYNEITAVDLTPVNHNLDYLDISNNLYEYLDTVGPTHIENFAAGSESLHDVKIANYNNFTNIYLAGQNINSIDFKNGINEGCFTLFNPCGGLLAPSLTTFVNPNQIVCVDDFPFIDTADVIPGIDKSEEQYFRLIINGDNNPLLGPHISTYCSFAPGGGFNTVSGNVRFDCGNTNQAINNIPISVVSGLDSNLAGVDDSGHYYFYSGGSNVTVTPHLENPAYFNITPPNYTYNPTTFGNNIVGDFCLSPNGVYHNLEMTIYPIGGARPGFDADYVLVCRNNGNLSASGTVNLTFNDTVLDFVTANPNTNSQSLNTLNWNFTNLAPLQSYQINLKLNANSQTETPSLNAGNILNFVAAISSADVDENPADNTANFNQTVVGSYDPNDKTVVEGSQVAFSNADEYLHYIVRFQNTGTAAAQNVVIKDVLDENLDWTSAQVVSASHPYRTTLTHQNQLEVFFEGINLPDSATDEPASHGYVAFKVKPRSTIGIGTEIQNTASIYFDFNFPIVTNTTTTTFATLGTPDFAVADAIKIYPNPVGNVLNIRSEDALIQSIRIYNVLGQLMADLKNKAFEKNSTVDVSNFKTGTYFISIESEKGQSTQRFIKK